MLDFPSPATVGQVFTAGSSSWVFDGAKWNGGTAGSGTVTSVTAGSGLTGSPNPITTAGTLTAQWQGGAVTTVGSGLSLASGTLSATGGAAVTVSDTAPASPTSGALWFDSAGTTTPMQLYLWYTDPTGSQWLPTTNPSWPAITYAMLPAEVAQVPIVVPFAGKPPASAVVNIPMTMALTLPAGLTGVRIFASTGPTASTAFTINRIPSGSTTPASVGTVTVTSQTACTLSGTGANFAAGDVLQIATPAQDATLADLGITLMTQRV